MILQRSVLCFIISYWSILVKLFNDHLIETALGHARHHLLVKLNKKLDFAPLEKLAADYHHHHHADIFDEVLRQIRSDYPDEYQIQIGETYVMRARAAHENLGPLIRHLSRHLLEVGLDSLPLPIETALRGFFDCG
jgi:hypothetical protein